MAQNTILYADLPTPVNAAFSTATTGGTIAAGTHYYRVSALDGNGGETLASTETSQVTTGSTSTVTVNWAKVTGATGYKVYGRATGAEQLLATVGDVATYTDTGSVTPSGVLPASNTTGTLAGTSTDVVLAAGADAKIGVFATGNFGVVGTLATLVMDTPGSDVVILRLTEKVPVASVSGPGTYRVMRGPMLVPIGAFSET